MSRRRERIGYFLVTLPIPDGASFKDVQEYIHDAVGSWNGSLRPPGGYGPEDEGDPLFGIERDSIKVEQKQRPKAK